MSEKGCRVLLLGPPALARDGEPVRIRLRKAIALVSYLCIEKRTYSRDFLANLLWPNLSQSSCLADLRRTLSIIRTNLGERCVVTLGDQVGMDHEDMGLDVDEFRALAHATSSGGDAEDLSRAAKLYRGSFLEGFNLGTCEDFDHWQDTVRQKLRWELGSLLESLTRIHLDAGDPASALPHAQRWLSLDDWNESAHRTLMETFARAGRKRAALEQYETCLRILHKEAIEPDERTVSLNSAIMANRLGPPGRTPETSAPVPVAAPPVHQPAVLPSEDQWVGREPELQALRVAWAEARQGSGRIVVITGEPGVGKTALAAEFAARVSGAGAVRRILLREGVEIPPYWPWEQLLHGRDDDTPTPSLHELLDVDEDSPQLVIFDRAFAILAQRARTRPQIFMLDNWHLADATSADLLAYAAAELDTTRVLVVITMRPLGSADERSAPVWLRRVAGYPAYRHLRLSGFSREETDNYLRARLPDCPTDDLLDAVHKRTRGNPLFLSETARMISSSSAAGCDGQVPDRLQLAVAARLDELPDDSRACVMAAAVLGEEANADELAAMVTSPDLNWLQSALGPALDLGILECASPTSWRFRHGLIRDVAYEAIPIGRLSQLHERAALALSTREDAEARAEQISDHLAHVTSSDGRELGRRYSCAAGRNSLRAHAYESALAHFLKAARALPMELRDEQDVEILTGLARSQFELARIYHSSEQHVDVGRALHQVANYWISRNQPARLARFVQDTEGVWFHTTDIMTQQLILTHLPAGAAHTLSTFPLQDAPRVRDMALRHHRRSVRIARRANDVGGEMQALLKLARLELFSNRFRVAWRHFRHLAEARAPESDVYSLAYAHQSGPAGFDFMVWYPASRGDLRHATGNAHAFMTNARRLGWTRSELGAAITHATNLRARGRFMRAEVLVSDAASTSPRDPRLLLIRCLLAHDTGNQRDARRFQKEYIKLEKEVRFYPTSLYAVSVLASIYKVTRDPDLVDTARSIYAELGAKGPRALSSDAVETGLALIAATEGDADLSAHFYRILRRTPRRMAGGMMISSDRTLALLARSCGRPLTTTWHFLRAIGFCRKLFLPELAWVCYDYAETLQWRGREKRSAKLLERSGKIARELGMTQLEQEISALPGSGSRLPLLPASRQ